MDVVLCTLSTDLTWHHDRYTGDIIHLNMFGKSIIILNSYKATKELLQQRSAIYNDRPRSILMGEQYVPNLPHCSQFRLCAKY